MLVDWLCVMWWSPARICVKNYSFEWTVMNSHWRWSPSNIPLGICCYLRDVRLVIRSDWLYSTQHRLCCFLHRHPSTITFRFALFLLFAKLRHFAICSVNSRWHSRGKGRCCHCHGKSQGDSKLHGVLLLTLLSAVLRCWSRWCLVEARTLFLT